MNIKKYFDLDFLKSISNDAKTINDLCIEDNGFLFKRFQDSNIFPDKEIIQSIELHAAITFLFKNYQLNDEDYIKYSSFMIDDSPIVQQSYQRNNISHETVIKILFDKNKGFTTPIFFLTKDDFIKYENLIIKEDLSYMRMKYLIDSFLSLKENEIKELPLSIFSKYVVLYNYSSHYLFNNIEHIKIFKDSLDNAIWFCDIIPFIEYIKRVNSIEVALSNKLPFENQDEDTLKKIYLILKKKDNNFTINDMFFHLTSTAKIEVIKKDYTKDFNPQLLIDYYLNNIDKLKEDFGMNYYNYLINININIPSILRHYLLLIYYLNSDSQLDGENNSTDIAQSLILLLADKEKTNLIDLSTIDANDMLKKLFYYSNNKNKPKRLILKEEMFIKVITLYYNQLFSKDKSIIKYFPKELFNIIYDNTKNNINKFIFLSQISQNNKLFFKQGIKKISLMFYNDLRLLSENKIISLDSSLFKEDCILKIKIIDGLSYMGENHIKILSTNALLHCFDNGVLLEDKLWYEALENFCSEYKFSDWQSQYIKINHQRKNNGLVFKKLILKIKEEHNDSESIFGNKLNHNDIISRLFTACAEKIEFIKDNKEVYVEIEKIRNNTQYEEHDYYSVPPKLIEIEKRINRVKNLFHKIDKINQEEIVDSISPNSFFEASVFTEATDKKEILTNYIISQFNKTESQRDLYFFRDFFTFLIKKDFWSIQSILIKENTFVYAVNNFKEKDFYNTLGLINFNKPKDEMEQRLKDYTIENHSDKLLFNLNELNDIWLYNMKDLYNIFKCLDDNNRWNFTTDSNFGLTFYLSKAIDNSSTEMFWDVLEKAKIDSPAIYTMLTNPLVIYDKINCGRNFLNEEFNLFKEVYFKENLKNTFKRCNEEKILSPYFFIYDFIDLNVVIKGINSIRESFAKSFSNEEHKHSGECNFNHEMFLHLHYIYNPNHDKNNKESETYLSRKKIKSFVSNLIESGKSNINIILRFPSLTLIYGKDNMNKLLLEKMNNVEGINSVFLKEFSSYYYKKNNRKKISFYTPKINYTYGLCEDLLNIFVKCQPENSLFLSYLCYQEDEFNSNFKDNSSISLKGNFKALSNVNNDVFGDKIHHLAEDFYNNSELDKKIKKEINKAQNYIIDENFNTSGDIVFKL